MTSHRKLTDSERQSAKELLDEIRSKLDVLANSDKDLLFALRRKIFKELSYDERDKPSARKAIKKKKWIEQERKCADCGEPMQFKYSHADRIHAPAGYNMDNIRLVHSECHHKSQSEKDYS